MKKILVVDDSALQRKMIIRIIREAGFENEVLESPDGEAAIQHLGISFEDVGLILCDWAMPKMSGIEFIEAIAEVSLVVHIPIVMITALDAEEKIKKAYTAHPNLSGYIKKPFTADQLKAVISPILKGQN